MFIRIFFALLCVLIASSLHAAARNGGGPQDLTYQNEAGQNEEDEEVDDGELAAPPPMLRLPPSVITSGPMGSSPLTSPQISAPPVMSPTIIAAPTREEKVERGELAAPVLTYYGVLDERSGSMPMDTWRTLTYHDAIAVLTNATQRVNSGNSHAILNDVLRVAALSRTYEPSWPVNSGGADLAAAYFNARIMAAQAAGDSNGALALFRTRPDTFKMQDWQAFIETEVRQRRFGDVCAISADKLVQDLSPFAQKMSILCDIKNGKSEPARLHLDLLREANDGDVLFLDLAERALNPNFVSKGKQVLKLENLSTLHVAALSLGKPKLKPEQIDKLMNPVQPIILDVPMMDAQRLKFAEHFARTGQLKAEDYQTILTSIKFPPKSIQQFRTNPESLLTVPEKEWPAPLRRAAALRAIAEEDNNTQKAHIIAAAMAGLTNADLLGPLGDALLANVSGLSALPDNVAAAPAMARLLLLRNGQDAASWWRLASASPNNREALLPVFPLALLRDVVKSDDHNWFENYGRTQAISAEKKNLNMAIIKILGVMLPSDEESQLTAQNVFPAMNAIDKRMDVLMGNLATGNSDGVLRALITLKGMRQDALAEKLALLNL